MQGYIFCTQCGTKLDETAKFCTGCGKPTGAEPSPAYAAPPMPPLPPPPYSNGPHAGTQTRRLRKIIAGKKISGVCAGYAEFFDIDVTLMRIIFLALLLLPPHIGLIAYIVSAFVLPKG